MRQKYDELWKGVIEEVFEDLLRFVFPRADELFDFQRGFEFLDKELNELYPEPGEGPHTRFVDKLVKVFLKDGSKHCFLTHVEVQGQPDKLFAERMFRYYYRILDRCKRPVTAIAIFTGADGKTMPDRYQHEFLGTEITYKYNALYLADHSDELLLQGDNSFALAFLAAKKALLKTKVSKSEFLEIKLKLATLIWGKGALTDKKVRAVLLFLDNLIFADKKTNRKFTNKFDQITGKQNTMGVLEILAEIREKEGREEERRLFAKNLLRQTEFSDEKIADLANISAEAVKKIRQRLSRKKALTAPQTPTH